MPNTTVPAAGEAMPSTSPMPPATMSDRLLEMSDKAFEVSNLVLSAEMATASVLNKDQRSALCSLIAVVGDNVKDLIELIELAREVRA
ncbi:hypothetical protein [Rhizobium sp. Leaf383]|uniref:hypothetical protein n=1 Tax=Rhizobium sp. Leaf383 TaxID=1736357 RepID=UPI0007133908|nr:hypothetical protein [Rhizobium sp. Leaf383]KQS83443.1 hypothetical protein ASG58_22175 [Rhizobium sp. Leaf383]